MKFCHSNTLWNSQCLQEVLEEYPALVANVHLCGDSHHVGLLSRRQAQVDVEDQAEFHLRVVLEKDAELSRETPNVFWKNSETLRRSGR